MNTNKEIKRLLECLKEQLVRVENEEVKQNLNYTIDVLRVLIQNKGGN